MVGQVSALERKSIEPMALQVEGGTIRGMQRFLSDVVWDEEQMLWHYHHFVADEMGAPGGILMSMRLALSKRARTPWVSRGSTVAAWGRSRIVKWACLPPMPQRARGGNVSNQTTVGRSDVIRFSFFDYTFVVCRAVWTACTKYAKPVKAWSAA